MLFHLYVVLTLDYLLLQNVRKVVQRQVAPGTIVSQTINGNLSYIHQIDGQLTTMLLSQSFGTQNFDSTITDSWYKSSLQLAVENLIIEIIRLFSYLFYSTSFYISLYSSHGFRKQVLHSLEIKRYCKPIN